MGFNTRGRLAQIDEGSCDGAEIWGVVRGIFAGGRSHGGLENEALNLKKMIQLIFHMAET